jgi:aerobic carbon-monoxide dehydrogenase large subunit
VAYELECEGVFTNTTPTDAYRGAGRPEATYAIERAVDSLARKLGKDPVELRRLNFIREFPATLASGLTIDSGDYDRHLDAALELLDLDELRSRQAERRERGDTRQLGIGFSTYVEMCGLAPSRILAAIRYSAGGWDAATVRFLPTGTVQVLIGTSPHGQSHVTTFSQIVAERLGVGYEEVEVLHGDTAVAPLGMDTYGSRSLTVGGIAAHFAAERIVEKARRIAAHQLEVDETELAYENGTFSANGKSMTTKEVALQAWTAHNLPDGMEPGLEASYVFDPENFSWPSGTHVGKVINPTVVEGQVHGGVAQGVAQALFEEAVYDEDGNLLTGSMVNYLVPTAAELPSFEVGRTETPSSTNPLGVKGVGETGTIASTAAVMNAVVDALSPYGITDLEMPATPERVWRAIEEAKR